LGEDQGIPLEAMLPTGLLHYHWKLTVYIYQWKKNYQNLNSCQVARIL